MAGANDNTPVLLNIMTSHLRSHLLTHQPRRQRGVYAIEFAFVFLIFFALVYTILCYGILFAFRFGLQNAAEDGARAALRYQVDLPARQLQARNVALARTENWLPVTALTEAVPVYSNGSQCGKTLDKRCRLLVTVTANGLNAVLPPFPAFAMPATLRGEASVLIDGRSL